jgi:hypothetical protein
VRLAELLRSVWRLQQQQMQVSGPGIVLTPPGIIDREVNDGVDDNVIGFWMQLLAAVVGEKFQGPHTRMQEVGAVRKVRVWEAAVCVVHWLRLRLQPVCGRAEDLPVGVRAQVLQGL